MADRTVRVRFEGQDVSLGRQLDKLSADSKRASSDVEGNTKKMSGAMQSFKGTLAALGTGAALAGLTSFAHGALDEAEEAEKVSRITNQLVRQTGADAWTSSAAISDLAGSISKKVGIDDEEIQAGENVLLTFKAVRNEAGAGNDVFDRATKVGVDLAAVMGGDLAGANKMLGKALQDPVKGLTAMTRAGVSFSQSQKDQVKRLVETGHTLEAQKLILKEVEGQVGGTAAAGATGTEKMRVAWKNLEEDVGTAVLPVLNELADVVGAGVDAFSEMPGWMKSTAVAGVGVATGAVAISKGYGLVKDGLKGVKGIADDVRGAVGMLSDRFSTSAAETVASTAEVDAGVASIGTTTVETSATVTTASAEADASLAGIGVAAQESATVTGEAFTGIGAEAQTLATEIESAKARSNVGSWGGGGFAGGAGGAGTDVAAGDAAAGAGGLGLRAAMAGAFIPATVAYIGGGPASTAPEGTRDLVQTILHGGSGAEGEAKTQAGRLKQAQDEVKNIQAMLNGGKLTTGVKVDKATGEERAGLTKQLAMYKAAVDQVTEAEKRAEAATSGKTGATDRDTTANTKNAESADHMVKRLTDYQDTLKAITDPVFAAVHAQDQLTKSKLEVMAATQDVDKAEREHGRNSDEYRQAVARLTDANQQQVESALGQQSAMAGLEAAFANGSVSADKMRITLQGWVAQGLITQAQADEQIRKMGLLKGAADRIDGTGVRIKASFDDAEARRGMLNFLGAVDRVKAHVASGVQAVASFVAGQVNKQRALGGHGSPTDGITLVGEQGPELVVFDRPGTVIPAGRTAQILAADSEARSRLGIQGFADGGRYEVGGASAPADTPLLRYALETGARRSGDGNLVDRIDRLADYLHAKHVTHDTFRPPAIGGLTIHRDPRLRSLGWFWNTQLTALSPEGGAPPLWLADPMWNRRRATLVDLASYLHRAGYASLDGQRLPPAGSSQAAAFLNSFPKGARPGQGTDIGGGHFNYDGATWVVIPPSPAPGTIVRWAGRSWDYDLDGQHPGQWKDISFPSQGWRRFADGGRPPLHTDVIVGEKGPEVARFDRPATIYPNGVTPPAAAPIAVGAVAGIGSSPIEVTIRMEAGAVVVQGTANMGRHELADAVAEGLSTWVRTQGGGRLRELVAAP